MNASKKREKRFWDRWRAAGAVSTAAVTFIAIDISRKKICDKCGRLVPPDNDALEFEYHLEHNPLLQILARNRRHLLPVVEDGVTVCPGSPSRAQYIKGQPRDTRGFPYKPKYEVPYRAAYEAMLLAAQ